MGRFKIPCPEIGPKGGRTGDHGLNTLDFRSDGNALGSNELDGQRCHDESAEKACGNGEWAPSDTDSGAAEHD